MKKKSTISKKLSPVTEKILQICDRIVEEGKAENMRELAIAIGFIQGGFSEIKRGNRTFTDEMKIALCKKYKVNARYFLPPYEKNMFLNEDVIEKAIRKKTLERAQLARDIENLKMNQ